MWDLYARLQTQWQHAGMAGIRTGFNYGPAIAVMEQKGWDLSLGVDLLSAIEHEFLNWDESERSKQSRD